MSAFLMKPESIGTLAAAAIDYGSLQYGITYEDSERFDNVEKVAAILAQANLNSLAARYGDDPNDEIFVRQCMLHAARIMVTRAHDVPDISLADLAKLAACFEYQSCEVGDWFETDAYRVLIQLRQGLLGNLPGYESSRMWG